MNNRNKIMDGNGRLSEVNILQLQHISQNNIKKKNNKISPKSASHVHQKYLRVASNKKPVNGANRCGIEASD